jgi:hypothetical protein
MKNRKWRKEALRESNASCLSWVLSRQNATNGPVWLPTFAFPITV